MDIKVEHLPEKHMFYAIVDGKESMMQYRILNATTWDYAHTFVPGALRGRGIASAIIKFALDYAREHHIKVKPNCPKVQSYLEQHHEYDDMLVEVD